MGFRDLHIGTRMALAIGFPALGLVLLALWLNSEYRRTADEMSALRHSASMVPALGALVHAVQVERGLSVGYAASKRTRLGERLGAAKAETDRRNRAFAESVANSAGRVPGGPVSPAAATLRHPLDDLDRWRATVTAGSMPADEVFDRYTEAITRLSDVATDLLVRSNDAAVSRTAYAYLQLGRAKEFTGRERAFGVMRLAAGMGFEATMEGLLSMDERQRSYLDSFRFVAAPAQVELLNRQTAEAEAAEGKRWSRIRMVPAAAGPADAEAWFDALTARVDRLRIVEDSVARELLGQVAAAESSARRAMHVVMAATALLLFLTAVVAVVMAREIVVPLRRITRSMTQLAAKDSVGAPSLAECARGDEVGEMARAMVSFSHALARAVQAQENRRSETDLRIAAVAFESQEGMVITNERHEILRVNRAFTQITGYTAEEVVGRTPAILKSGQHDAPFYAAMRRDLDRNGSWRGEVLNRRKNGELYPQLLSISAVQTQDRSITHYVGTMTDISDRKATEHRIRQLAFYDPLTALPNRRLMLDRLEHALHASRRSGRLGALLFIDLDNFKTVNDSRGHAVGDSLLAEVARRLMASVRASDTVARIGGDEFVVVIENLPTRVEEAAAWIETVGAKIQDELGIPYLLAGSAFHSTPSIGATLFGHAATSADELMRQADMAMYQAKSAGRNTLRFFDPAMQTAVTERALMEGSLREALKSTQFELHYQPQVDGAGRVTGVEALVRWRRPDRGFVSPAEFIPLAEDTGLILPLGEWVLETACAQLAEWAKDPRTADLSMAVNVSARQFHHRDFANLVLAIVDATGANPHRLKIELTESLLAENLEDIIRKMTLLKRHGVSFSLDDFGTGYSSLSYLKRLPLDQLKIDQSFVRDILTDPNDAVIARTIITLARSLGLGVIAEGVENEQQRSFLAEHGCDEYQGYLFGKPSPAQDCVRHLA